MIAMIVAKLNLRQLMARLRAKEHRAYREFYDGTVRQVTAHLRKMGLTDPQDLEDVLQETYAQAFAGCAALNDDQAALAWLLTIARRTLARHRERGAAAPATASDDLLRELADERPSPPEAQIDAVRLCAGVRRLAAGIGDERRRQAIEMFYFQDMSLGEIGRVTAVGTSTLTTWLARFRQEARRLAAEGEERAAAPRRRALVGGP